MAQIRNCCTVLFNSTTANINNVVQTNAHTNAIDIYMYDDNANVNGGRAMGFLFPQLFPNSGAIYTNDAVMIGGELGGNLMIGSNVLSHEIAHVLGLLHVFEEDICVELVDRSNCLDCGDLICDTDASFNVNFNPNVVTEAGCNYVGNRTDVNGDIYTLDPENIMEYSHAPCLQHFSVGQGERMRGFLSNESDLQPLIVENDYVLNNSNFSIGNDLLYAANHTLTISDINISLSNHQDITFKASESITLLPNTKIISGVNASIFIEESCNTIDEVNSARIIPINTGLVKADLHEKGSYKYGKVNSLLKSKINFSCLPNPAKDILNLKFNNNEENLKGDLVLMDIGGRTLLQKRIQLSEGVSNLQINVSTLDGGLYFLVFTSSEHRFTEKVMINN